MPVQFEFFDANARIGTVPNANPRHFTTADELLREMDLFGVAEAVVWHAWCNRWDPDFGHEDLMKQVAGRDRLHPARVVLHHYTTQAPPPPRLVSEMLDQGTKVAKLFFGTWGSSAGYMPWAYEELLSALEGARIPVVIEWENQTPQWNDLAHICGTYPRLPVILTHPKLTQWERDWYPLMAKFANFHIETAGYQGWRGLEGLCRLFGPERMLFSTRAPVYQVGQSMSMVARTLRPAEERQMIAAGNLRRLLAEVGN